MQQAAGTRHVVEDSGIAPAVPSPQFPSQVLCPPERGKGLFIPARAPEKGAQLIPDGQFQLPVRLPFRPAEALLQKRLHGLRKSLPVNAVQLFKKGTQSLFHTGSSLRKPLVFYN